MAKRKAEKTEWSGRAIPPGLQEEQHQQRRVRQRSNAGISSGEISQTRPAGSELTRADPFNPYATGQYPHTHNTVGQPNTNNQTFAPRDLLQQNQNIPFTLQSLPLPSLDRNAYPPPPSLIPANQYLATPDYTPHISDLLHQNATSAYLQQPPQELPATTRAWSGSGVQRTDRGSYGSVGPVARPSLGCYGAPPNTQVPGTTSNYVRTRLPQVLPSSGHQHIDTHYPTYSDTQVLGTFQGHFQVATTQQPHQVELPQNQPHPRSAPVDQYHPLPSASRVLEYLAETYNSRELSQASGLHHSVDSSQSHNQSTRADVGRPDSVLSQVPEVASGTSPRLASPILPRSPLPRPFPISDERNRPFQRSRITPSSSPRTSRSGSLGNETDPPSLTISDFAILNAVQQLSNTSSRGNNGSSDSTAVKKILAVDEDIGAVSANASFAITIATEMFIRYFADQAMNVVKSEKKPRRNIQYKDLANAVSRIDNLSFLEDTVPKTTTYREYRSRKARANQQSAPIQNGQTTLDAARSIRQRPVSMEDATSSTLDDASRPPRTAEERPTQHSPTQPHISNGQQLIFEHYEPNGSVRRDESGDVEMG